MENSIKLPHKMKNLTFTWSSNSISAYFFPKKQKTKFEEKYVVLCSFNIIYQSQDMEAAYMPIYYGVLFSL